MSNVTTVNFGVETVVEDKKVADMRVALKTQEETMKKEAKKVKDAKALKGNVTRKEFAEVLAQFTENLNVANDYMMQDLNALYGSHLFPNEIKMAVLEEALIEKGIITSEELVSMYNKRLETIQAQAQEIKKKQEEAKEAEASTTV